MSNFYTIRLRRFESDSGFTGGERQLKNLSRTTPEGLPIANRQAAANDGAVDNRVFLPLIEEVVIDVSPTVSESRTVNYDDQGLPGPQGIVVYKTTNNRRFSISARFVSRNLVEGIKNFYNINLLKSWAIPQGGGEGDGKFGRPPILRLNGYKDQFLNIPVVMSNLTINYPEDVDYIEAANAMVPIIQNVDIELIESHAVSTLRLSASGVSDDDGQSRESEFNLAKFKLGQLPGY